MRRVAWLTRRTSRADERREDGILTNLGLRAGPRKAETIEVGGADPDLP